MNYIVVDLDKMIKDLDIIDKRVWDKIIKYEKSVYENKIKNDKNILRNNLNLKEKDN